MVKITPILQNILMSQLAVVMDHLNNHRFYKSWDALKVLIKASPEAVKNKMNNKMMLVQSEITKITSDKQQDINQQRATQTYRINRVCARHMYSLLEETMNALYAGGYLEF